MYPGFRKSPTHRNVMKTKLDETNLAGILKAGAVNFCAVRAIMQSPDPENVIRALQQIWRASA